MKILFSGDSFTYGDELSNREKDRFSRLVSEHYSAEEINRAECGSSNDKIVRDVFEYLHLFNVDAVVIQFSILRRFDAYKDGWVGMMPEDTGGKYCHAPEWKKTIARAYYKHVQNDRKDQERYFGQILLLQSFLKQKKIPYVMLGLESFKYRQEKIYYNYIKDFCEDFEYIIPDLIGAYGSENYCPDLTHINSALHGMHPNEKGHSLIADHITSKL